jgi:hypothetical protein
MTHFWFTNDESLRTNELVLGSPFYSDCLELWLTYEWTEWVLSLMLRSTVSRPVFLGIKHPSGAYVQIFIIVWQLQVFWFGVPSLTRGRVCRLQLQLALASAVIFRSESRRTRGHILLSQIQDFPFRRLLRLAGSRWRYSTPPPHGSSLLTDVTSREVVSLSHVTTKTKSKTHSDRWSVCLSVCLGVEPWPGLITRCFFLFESYCPVYVGNWMNYVSSLCKFGMNQIEITISNSSSIILCLSVAVGTCVNFTATVWFLWVYDFQLSYPWKRVL